MHNLIEPLTYSSAAFLGYRLLKRSAGSNSLYRRLLASILGLVFIEGSWIIEYFKIPTGVLLAGIIPGMIFERILNSSSGKTSLKTMPVDEMLLWIFIPIVGVFVAIKLSI
jgi:hypothetical protein